MTDVTYIRLEGVLRPLGFSLRAVEEKNKVYRHEGAARNKRNERTHNNHGISK